MAQEFELEYSNLDYYVFWKFNPREKNPICGKLKEFLFDIAVCQFLETESLEQNPKGLNFVAQAHWLVESEFDRNNFREIILDMSKLVIGTSSYKLFVAAHRREKTEQKILEKIAPLAQCCDLTLFLAFVSHPDVWFKRGQADPVIYHWCLESDQWLLFAG